MFDDLTHVAKICGVTRKALEKQHIFALLFFLPEQVHLFNYGRGESCRVYTWPKLKSVFFSIQEC